MLRPRATDDEILELVGVWCSLLARGDYAGALVLIPGAAHWTPDLLERVIANYGSPVARTDGRSFRVTPIESAHGGPAPRHDVAWYGSRGEVWFDLPLNGAWSDLTATFDIDRTHDGISSVMLDDVHVH